MPATGELRFPSTDGVLLEGERTLVEGARVAAVLCHPHPQYGGSMRAGVIGDLFRELSERGVSTLRFNFRGVERSAGSWDEGRAERGDVAAAVEALATAVPPSVPLVVVGWSFGADMALSVTDARIAGWCAIAPPLHFATDLEAVAADARPKHLVLGERDDLVPAPRVAETTASWTATTCEVVPGATHFFLGRSAEVVAAVFDFCLAVSR